MPITKNLECFVLDLLNTQTVFLILIKLLFRKLEIAGLYWQYKYFIANVKLNIYYTLCFNDQSVTVKISADGHVLMVAVYWSFLCSVLVRQTRS